MGVTLPWSLAIQSRVQVSTSPSFQVRSTMLGVEETIEMSSRELLHHNQNLHPRGKVIKVWHTWQFEKKKCDAVSWGRNKSPLPMVMIGLSLGARKGNHGKKLISRVGGKKNDSGIIFSVFLSGNASLHRWIDLSLWLQTISWWSRLHFLQAYTPLFD